MRLLRKRGCLVLSVLSVLLGSLVLASPAEAYLDPGTGSMLVSALIGIAAAIALALKMTWYRFVGWLRGKSRGTARGGATDA